MKLDAMITEIRRRVRAMLREHEVGPDPHPGYQKESEKGAANGYAELGAASLVPTAQLGTGAAGAGVFLRGDQTWAAAGGSGGGIDDALWLDATGGFR